MYARERKMSELSEMHPFVGDRRGPAALGVSVAPLLGVVESILKR